VTLPLRHVSIRVPWHDTAWDGRVCANPGLNGSCLRLKGIAQNRDDAAEQLVAGQPLNVLPQEKWPCCVSERVSFMAPFELTRVANHPYKRTSEGTHGHFAPTSLRLPPYSAAAVPFAWMLRESMESLGEQYALDVQPEREPDLGFKTQWIQERLNQTALLSCFSDHLKVKQSLCFFYAKHVPFVEDAGARRILVGVGRVLHTGTYCVGRRDGCATRSRTVGFGIGGRGGQWKHVGPARSGRARDTEAPPQGVHRLILIGDPRQLPPIGAGRPFVDIVKHLAPAGVSERFPRVGPGYAELTIRRRQAGVDREDLQLAEWFSGSPIAPGEDDVFDKVVRKGESQHVRFVQWSSVDELRSRLVDVLVQELDLAGPDDIAGFDATLGGTPWNDMRFFNFGAAMKAEGWQILSPVRSGGHGVPELNRLIHGQFREQMVEAAQKRFRKYPKPMGPEQIVYGDKVINLVNTDPTLRWNRHRKVFPEKTDPYIANGEIGMAIGFFWKKGLPDFRWKLEVEFSSQPRFKYDFTSKDFSEEGNPVLELAYALTVHKAQGSEFGTVILVLPNPCRLLSREMLYTALTRQKNRVVILHQGARTDLRKFSSDDRSETARRLTNLFYAPSPIAIDGRFFEENLIHRTARGDMVRSKSEVIIADHLARRGVEYAYEQALTIDGETKYPDFTIEDAESGLSIFWEHCGMLHVPNYRRRWEEKLAWYKAHGIVPHGEGAGSCGTLVITRDNPDGSIDSSKITSVLEEVLNA